MCISVEEALQLIKGSSKYGHMLLVSRIMTFLAKDFKAPEQIWLLVGMLHDLDYDKVDDITQHGIIASEQLKNKLPSEAIHAIQAHDVRTGIKPTSLLDDALIFADSLADFIKSRSILGDDQSIFREKPWLSRNIEEFQEKYEYDASYLLEQFQYL